MAITGNVPPDILLTVAVFCSKITLAASRAAGRLYQLDLFLIGWYLFWGGVERFFGNVCGI